MEVLGELSRCICQCMVIINLVLPYIKNCFYCLCKALDECLIKPFDSDTAAHSTEILDFYRAYQLQRVILIGKSKICPEPLPYQKLKELVEKSGKTTPMTIYSYEPYTKRCIRLCETHMLNSKKRNSTIFR